MSIKRWDGTSQVNIANFKRWDGSSWVKCNNAKRWDGSSWVAFWSGKKTFFLSASNSSYLYDPEQNACGLIIDKMDTVTRYARFTYTPTIAINNATISFSWMVNGGQSPTMGGFYVAMFMSIKVLATVNGSVNTYQVTTDISYNEGYKTGISSFTIVGTVTNLSIEMSVPGFSSDTWTTGAFCTCLIQNCMVNGETYSFNIP